MNHNEKQVKEQIIAIIKELSDSPDWINARKEQQENWDQKWAATEILSKIQKEHAELLKKMKITDDKVIQLQDALHDRLDAEVPEWTKVYSRHRDEIELKARPNP